MAEHDRRLLQLDSGALSGKQCKVVAFTGSEGVSALFTYTLELVSDDAGLDAAAILGKATTILLNPSVAGGEKRYFHGHISEFFCLGVDAGGTARYRAVLVPKLWFLGLACRVQSHAFEGKSDKAIYTSLLKAGNIDFKVLADASAPINYFQIQYNETDLDFLLRFLAEVGVSFYFEHTRTAHKMVLVDSSAKYSQQVGPLRFSLTEGFADSETVRGWRRHFQCFAPKAVHIDYDNKRGELMDGRFKVAGAYQSSPDDEARVFAQGVSHGEPQVTGTPTLPKAAAATQAKTDVRRQAARYQVISADSNCVGLFAGVKFTLKEKPPGGARDYIVTRIEHAASDGADDDTRYSNTFDCVAGDTDLAPMPRPAVPIHGTLLARVTKTEYQGEAPGGRHYGLVKVAFPWDPKVSTPWIQVCQSFGGDKNSGAWFLPQLDDDVLISFINGDTRRPLVVGVVHSGAQRGPSFTKGHGDFTRVGIRTPAKHELSFYGKPGASDAEVYLESGHDFNRDIAHDEVAVVANDQATTVNHDQQVTVKNNQSTTVKNSQEVDVGKTLTIRAGTSIELKVGTSKVKIDSRGIVLSTASGDVKVDGLNVDIKGKVNAKVNGTMTELSGSGITQVKGSLVKIN